MLNEMNDIQMEVGEWSQENFGAEQPSYYPLMGAGEEIGELIHSILKRHQGIREDDEDVGDDAERDAVGDIGIYLLDFLYREGYTLDLTSSIRDNTEDMVNEMDEGEVIGCLFNSYSRIWMEYPDFTEEESLQSVVMVFVILDVLCQQRERLGGLRYCIERAWYDEVQDREWDADVEVEA